jgi:hypothetical protein
MRAGTGSVCQSCPTRCFVRTQRLSPVLWRGNRREAARRASEAQIDLVRIRRARHDLLVRRLQKAQPTPEASRTSNPSEPKSPQNKSTVMLTEIPEEFTLLDRYERRALSRRRFALRELDALRQPTSP